jgi:polar amino acid transport system substrate-binding protein
MLRKVLSLWLILLSFSVLNGCSDSTSGEVVRVAVSPAMPPLLYKKDGKIVGADYDIFKAFCKKLGCTMKVTAYDFKDMLDAVASGQADVAFSAISITEDRKKIMDFSAPYFYNDWHIVSTNQDIAPMTDLANLQKYKLGYPKGSVYAELVQWELEPRGYYASSQAKLYPSYTEIMTELQSGDLDLTIFDEPVYRFFKSDPNNTVQSIYTFSDRDTLGFAFAKGSTLREKFDNFLIELGPKAIDEMINKAYHY